MAHSPAYRAGACRVGPRGRLNSSLAMWREAPGAHEAGHAPSFTRDPLFASCETRAVASAVTAIAGKSAAPFCHANGVSLCLLSR